MNKKKYKLIGLFICSAILTGCLMKKSSQASPSSKEEKNQVGLKDSKFYPCPPSPNCVSSMVSDTQHMIEPFAFDGLTQSDAKDYLLAIINQFPRTKVITQQHNYVHAEFKTKWMGFIDDVEFYFPEDASIIHIKSASRVGYHDMGTNRKRLESLRQLYYKAQFK